MKMSSQPTEAIELEESFMERSPKKEPAAPFAAENIVPAKSPRNGKFLWITRPSSAGNVLIMV